MLNNLHTEVLPPATAAVLSQLLPSELLRHYYLAGGTALALQLGHRQSEDLDFFTKGRVEDGMSFKVKALVTGPVEVISTWPGGIDMNAAGAKLSFWSYHYPVLEKNFVQEGLQIATPLSIGLFKLIAITSRTTWKDIVDLWFIHQIHPLPGILDRFQAVSPREFKTVYNGVRNLIDEELLSVSPLPKMLRPVNLEEAKEEIVAAIRSVIEKQLEVGPAAANY